MNGHRFPLLILLAALASMPAANSLRALEPPASLYIGDADGNGEVDLDDLRLVEHAVETGHPTAGSGGLSDLAEPCDRELDGADVAMLKKALDGFELGLDVASHCHGQAVGSLLPAPPPAAPETLDEVFAAIAAEVPEFGGLYFDTGGVPTMVLTDPGVWAVAEAAVFARFSPERLGSGALNAIRGAYSFGELYGYRDLARDLLTLPGAIGLDVDEVANRLVVTVDSEEAQDAALTALEGSGIPPAAVAVEISAPLESFESLYQEYRRPMRAGIQLGGCSLGPIVERQGARGFLTAAHCTAAFGAEDKTPFFQPSADDPSWQAGTEAFDPPLFGSDGDSRCPDAAACRWSDAVFVATPFDSPTHKGTVQTDDSWQVRRITGRERLPLAGETISKSGQRTGQTSGPIRATCIDLWNPDVEVLLLCQYLADMAGAEGDSGAPAFAEAGADTARLFGMVWGGEESLGVVAFSGVDNLESELGWLDFDWGDGAPRVELLSPAHREDLGVEAPYEVEISVRVRDHEDGAECAGCTVDLSASVDGYLGSAPVIGGEAHHDDSLSAEGYQVLTAEAIDASGELSDDWALISTGSADPVVWVEFPEFLTEVPAGYDTMFVAGSLDPDTFSALPCSQLEWETNVATDAVYTGCTPIVRYDTLGPRDLIVTGTDSCGDTGQGLMRFEVVPAPVNGPPYVTILEPGSGTMVWRHETVDLVGKARDPNGQSPIQYEWLVSGPKVIGGEVVIGTDSGPDDQALAPLTWAPANDVYSNCGGSSVVIKLRATDAAGDQSTVEMPFHIAEGPC